MPQPDEVCAAIRPASPQRQAADGAVSYHHRWPDPYPSVFGYHEVFHVYVCAAAACQYAAIARFAG